MLSQSSSLKSDLIKLTKVLVVGLVLTFGANYLFADWSAPLSTPPTCTSGNPGCDAPITVSSVNQYKTGGLAIGTNSTATLSSASLDVEGAGLYADVLGTKSAIIDALNIPTNAAAGDVLVSDANGNATWSTTVPSQHAGTAIFMLRSNSASGYGNSTSDFSQVYPECGTGAGEDPNCVAVNGGSPDNVTSWGVYDPSIAGIYNGTPLWYGDGVGTGFTAANPPADPETSGIYCNNQVGWFPVGCWTQQNGANNLNMFLTNPNNTNGVPAIGCGDIQAFVNYCFNKNSNSGSCAGYGPGNGNGYAASPTGFVQTVTCINTNI